MSRDTAIQYLDSDVSPTSGCDGCELAVAGTDLTKSRCYARALHERRLAKAHPSLYDESFFNVRTIPGRMAKAARWSDLRGVVRPDKPWIPAECPRIIGISFLSDALSQDVPFDFLKTEVFDVVRSSPGNRHIWVWLTKQTDRLWQFERWLDDRGIAWPANLMMCVSVTSPKTVQRMAVLEGTAARMMGISIEPILAGPINLPMELVAFDWVLYGGCSDQGAGAVSTNLAHLYHISDQCEHAGVTSFLKQLGSDPIEINSIGQILPLMQQDSHGGDINEWPYFMRGWREVPVRRFIEAVETAQAEFQSSIKHPSNDQQTG